MEKDSAVAIILTGFALVAVAPLLWIFSQPGQETPYHSHADFKVVLDGKEYNFSQEKYMTAAATEKSSRVHLHDLDGKIIHVHAKGVTLGEFFRTLGMKFTVNCFETDSGEKYCNNGNQTLKLLVNGKPNNLLENYEILDLDRVLVSYGNENRAELQQQIDSVSDRACIFSGKCPERGPSSSEPCSQSVCTP